MEKYDHTYYWRKDYFESLQEAATAARSNPEWYIYADFCSLLEKGLRKQAFERLTIFIDQFRAKPLTERKAFVSWLLHRTHDCLMIDDHSTQLLVPYPLTQGLIQPTLDEWIAVEPEDFEPYRWVGTYDSLKHALSLNPNDDNTKVALIRMILGGVGCTKQDLLLVDEASILNESVKDEQVKQFWRDIIAEERAEIGEYCNESH